MTVRRSVIAGLIVVAGSVSLAGRAQTGPAGTPPQPAKATASILGVVSDADRRPVAGATVALSASATPNQSVVYVITDSAGRFVFLDLAAGSYSLRAEKPGYMTGESGAQRVDGRARPLVLAADQRVMDAGIQIWKYGAIGGVVADEAGEPVIGVAVEALPIEDTGGQPRIMAPTAVAHTDDRGFYRLSRLTPRNYVVVVPNQQTTLLDEPNTPPAAAADGRANLMTAEAMMRGRSVVATGTTDTLLVNGVRLVLSGTMSPPIPTADGHLAVYDTAYFPGTTDGAAARSIAVRSGQEVPGIDFHLQSAVARRVSGTVTGVMESLAKIAIRLVPFGARRIVNDPDAAVAYTDAKGAFMFPAVPRGTYELRVLDIPHEPLPSGGFTMTGTPDDWELQTLMARVSPLADKPTYWAAQPLVVADRDLTDVVVPLARGARIRGRIEYQQQGAAPPRPASVQVSRADGHRLAPQGFSPAAVNDAREFQTIELPPGQYFVSGSPGNAGWAFVRATLQGRDISSEPLELVGTNAEGIVITITDRPTELGGVVRGANGQTDASAAVLVFPANERSWMSAGSLFRQFVEVRTGTDGAFVTNALPPGDYIVAAVPDANASGWRAPASLQALSRIGLRVHLDDGEHRTLDLKTSAIR